MRVGVEGSAAEQVDAHLCPGRRQAGGGDEGPQEPAPGLRSSATSIQGLWLVPIRGCGSAALSGMRNGTAGVP